MVITLEMKQWKTFAINGLNKTKRNNPMKNEIKPTYVTWEQAKWIKEKGFIEPTLTYWSKRDGLIENEINLRNHNERGEWGTSRPEQHVVVEWLRVNHGVWVSVNIAIDDKWYFELYNLKDKRNAEIIIEDEGITDFHSSPKEAYSAAFDYIKDNNLI